MKEITSEEFIERYLGAAKSLVDLIINVQCNDPEMFNDDPWSVNGFRYYVPSHPEDGQEGLDGVVVAERKQPPGPREPGLIWDGEAWFCSEDGNEEQLELGWRLSKLSPGGIGGF